MKLLFDQNLSHKLCARLAELFPGSEQVLRLGLATALDMVIWGHAKAHGFTIVSQDVDFSNLSAVYGHPPKVLWLRCGNQTTAVIESLLRRHAAAIELFGQDAVVGCLEIFA